MNIMKSALYMVLCTTVIIFISTYIPDIYQPNQMDVNYRISHIQQEYEEIAEAMGITKTAFAHIVEVKDIEEKTEAHIIQKKAYEACIKQATNSEYVLDKHKMKQIAVQMQMIYETFTSKFTNTYNVTLRWISFTAFVFAAFLLAILKKVQINKF